MVWFLVDTGGTHSYLSINTRSALGWNLHDDAFSNGDSMTRVFQIEGLQHRFVTSEHSDNHAIWDINLFSADLLQYFTLIDDAYGQTLLLIPRLQQTADSGEIDFN
jgi:hypothetical protein